MSTAKRPTAPRQAKPAQRYFRGKAPVNAGGPNPDSDENSDEEEGNEPMELDAGEGAEDDEEDDGGVVIQQRPKQMGVGKSMNVTLRDVNITEGKVIVAGREEVGRTEMEGE